LVNKPKKEPKLIHVEVSTDHDSVEESNERKCKEDGSDEPGAKVVERFKHRSDGTAARKYYQRE
jgi:hypothetical protein